VSRATAYRLMTDGALPVYHFGGRIQEAAAGRGVGSVIVSVSVISDVPYWFAGASMTAVLNPSASETAQLRELRQLVKQGHVNVVGSKGRKVPLPRPVVGLLDEILKNMQAGRAVSIVPEHQELTTQRAANMLGVSRPFMVRLLEEDKLPFHMVGSHRRVYLKDVLAYKARRDRERHVSIVRMARMEKKAGTYDKVILPPGAQGR